MLSRLRPRLNHATVVAYLALFVALGGGALAAKSFLGSDGQLHGCVSKSGKLKLVHSASSKCPKHNSKIAWSQKGPQGIQGLTGKTGPQGPGAISLNTAPYSGTTAKTFATASGLDVTLKCGSSVELDLSPATGSSGGVITEGFESFNGNPPLSIDDSSSFFGAQDNIDAMVEVFARAASSPKWSHFDLVANRNGGNNTCTLGGLITPSS